jgi:hypothetical protein
MKGELKTVLGFTCAAATLVAASAQATKEQCDRSCHYKAVRRDCPQCNGRQWVSDEDDILF